MKNYILMALLATIGTWFVTALGAGTVIFFKKPLKKILKKFITFSRDFARERDRLQELFQAENSRCLLWAERL